MQVGDAAPLSDYDTSHLITKGCVFKTVCANGTDPKQHEKTGLLEKQKKIPVAAEGDPDQGHLLVADDDFAVLRFAKNLEAFPQHVLGHAARQVMDVEHLAVVLATGEPWQQSGQRTIQNTDRRGN